MKRTLLLAAVPALLGLAAAGPALAAPESAESLAAATIHYRSETIDGVKVFYREAGPADGPVVLLLHGFPTSSHMFRNLIPLLADKYRVIAPDYPGFGQSDAPDHTAFDYSFAHNADIVDTLAQRLGARKYAMYVMDYGAPVGYRLALKHPERVSGLIIQNGNAYEEGLREFWDPIKAYWAEDTPERRQAMAAMVTPGTTRFQYTDGMGDLSRISPDSWTIDQALLDRPGNSEIQYDLFYDYRTNVPLYPQFQKFFRDRRPPALIVWGRNDKIFPAEGASPYLRDLPDAEFHMIDSGHFALEDRLAEMAPLIRDFLDRRISPR
ncbi:MAG: alpha/beta hydrolase [Candidatus Andeanibacterium colombiense]|uniref:Alpha/beta hydrolase n=1 Tax=Candidatus Andeanibacterium colombiense TaxID=3121345 RepID=A0AAJ5X816_9SPHN|nr:MAG: alpha/beta hydrolase [Sphingomonadaceae bacterium]